MKNIKKILIVFMILILSGCSVEYNLNINEDNSVNETVLAKEKTNRMESLTRLKDKQAISYLFNMFKRDNEDIKITSRNDNYNTYATATTTHSNIDEYSSKFTSDVFKNVNIQRDNNVVKFTANQSKKLGEEDDYSLVYDDITVNISVPYKVVENNADRVYKSKYTWYIKKGESKNIKFSYIEGSKTNSVNINVKDKTYNINYGIIVSSGIILLVLIFILYIHIKNNKNNLV